ncbi:bifunctional oligoribonuclease/PAP phosphatase NrnA [Enterococcus pseudoavium]|uniref:Bifunctional oligoribonuclease/PAP phosphatase NrnA n=1 Tax=Enterococcus pseudoavium TaxID=44007 RepID=A0ABU3FKK9_9ENTE|nr:bifunctional oligoribonuclease/PAP phosphatase NrnA [Enterococcus pseudoavium]MDT2755689.1 bifunctional oligoribonuclease/PAP phosphatase NrnA [Enterococcus pseudoavium]MDT2771605.1 bifunctional oligoribonuclease/PAP phosphatase NrnA [Enterococcus pseudoavium]
MTITTEILAMIKKYERIIIHRHQRPDPDAIGSQCGLAEILRANFPEKEIYQVGGPVEGLDYLATMDEISDDLYTGALVIVTDTANAPRISDKRYELGAKLIKIDHHPNDDPYGDLLWVNPKASSCSEIIADFAFAEKLTVTENAARLLYGGIVGDTGRFLYPATTSHTLQVAAKLLEYGFDAAKLNRQIDQISLEVAKLSGYLYQNLQIDGNGAGYVILDQTILKKYGIKDSDTAALVPLPGTIETVLAWAVFVEQPEGYYRVRLRSKGPVINELAKRYHGGGHPLASGANAKDQAMCQEIYHEIQALCADYQEK